MTDVMETFSREGGGFIDRHPELNDAQKTMGGITWGIMRAVMECPNCPGHYRVPQDKDYQVLFCGNCGMYWDKQSEAVETPRTKKKAARQFAEAGKEQG